MSESHKSVKLNDVSIMCDILHLLYRDDRSWDQIFTRFSDKNHDDVYRIVLQLDSNKIIGMGFDQGSHNDKWSLKI